MSKRKDILSTPTDPALARIWRSAIRRKADTIHEFACRLVQLVHYRDRDGREIGFDYEYIRETILRRFPKVKIGGPHRGRVTKMPYKELQKVTGELNRQGVRLPFRPRRKTKKNN